MRIGQFSKAAGVTPSKIRFYEARGLLPRAGRQSNGYRSYGSEDVERLLRVRRAQELGFSLDQIALFMNLSEQDRRAKLGVIEAAEAKLAQIDHHLSEVRGTRRRLIAFIAEVQASKRAGAPPQAAGSRFPMGHE